MESTALITILKNATDGILNIDYMGKIESVNPSACNLFGYAPEEMIRKNFAMLLANSDQLEGINYNDTYLPAGEVNLSGIRFEMIGKKKGGSIFPFRIGLSEVECCGRTGYTCFIHDLTLK